MAKLNTITIEGNLTRAPELKYLQNGTPVANFGFCYNDSKKEGDNWVDVPNFFDGEMWNKRAEFFAENCKKGDHVVISGKLRQHSFTDKNGNNRSKVSITAFNALKIERLKKADGAPAAGNVPDDDDVPF